MDNVINFPKNNKKEAIKGFQPKYSPDIDSPKSQGEVKPAKIYLAGELSERKFEDIVRERHLIKKLIRENGLIPVDPVRCRDHNELSKLNIFTIKNIIARDEHDLSNSNAILVLTGDKPTSGTWFEFAYAHYVLKIPIVVVAPKMLEDNNFGNWTFYKATKVVPNVIEAITWLRWFFSYE